LKGEGNNDLPDAITNWKHYRNLLESNAEAEDIERAFGDKRRKAFVVNATDIASNKYDLSINRYREVVYEEEHFEDPKLILGRLKRLEQNILADLNELEVML
jgi:type I restriction enzyme M protein